VLPVLLSQAHRLRAHDLLGPWPVNLALSCSEEDKVASAGASPTMLVKSISKTRVSSEDKLSRQMMQQRGVWLEDLVRQCD